MSELFNSKLSAEIDNLNNKYPEARMVYGDIYYSLLDIIHSPQKYGTQCSSNFKPFILETKICLQILIPVFFLTALKLIGFQFTNIGCCGTGKIEVAEICKCACPDVSKYLFWDSFHPTEKAYRILVHEFLQQNINSIL